VQQTVLSDALGLCRFLYNAALQERRDAWRQQRVSVSFNQQSMELVGAKCECSELDGVYSQVLQDVLHRADKTFKAFFRRCQRGETPGHPRFKGRDRYDSFTYPQLGFKLVGNTLQLSKIGQIKIKLHRPIVGKVKTVTIKRACGKWYAIFSCDIGDVPAKRLLGNPVGMDVGLESFAVLSDGTTIENPRCLRKSEDALAARQRRLSAKVKGSARRRKARLLVAKAHLKIKRQRRDFAHKTARKMVEKYDLIAFEKLNINGMVHNHCLAKSVSDAGWGSFLAILSNKAEEAGCTAVAVNPRGTSIQCSYCGFLVQKTLSIRQHICPNCGVSVSRDFNASRNIIRLGLSLQGSP
jgi:putative transposase